MSAPVIILITDLPSVSKYLANSPSLLIKPVEQSTFAVRRNNLFQPVKRIIRIPGGIALRIRHPDQQISVIGKTYTSSRRVCNIAHFPVLCIRHRKTDSVRVPDLRQCTTLILITDPVCSILRKNFLQLSRVIEPEAVHIFIREQITVIIFFQYIIGCKDGNKGPSSGNIKFCAGSIFPQDPCVLILDHQPSFE